MGISVRLLFDVFELLTIFWAVFRYRSNLISQKILSRMFGSLKCVFPKCTFLGPQLNRLGRVWYLLNLLKALALLWGPVGTKAFRELDKMKYLKMYIFYSSQYGVARSSEIKAIIKQLFLKIF